MVNTTCGCISFLRKNEVIIKLNIKALNVTFRKNERIIKKYREKVVELKGFITYVGSDIHAHPSIKTF